MRKNTFYIAVLALILSCNKKESNSGSLNFPKNISPKTNKHVNFISKESSEKKKINSDTVSLVKNDIFKINNELNGAWIVAYMYFDKHDDEIPVTLHFDANKKTLDTYINDEWRESFNYEIVATNCENNNKNLDSCYIKLSGDGIYCSKIIDIKHVNNKAYLILNDNITDLQDKEFVKLSNDPNFFPHAGASRK